MRIAQDVLEVLSASTVEGNMLRLPPTLERKLYERTNKVLEAAGGKWNKKAKAHVFEEDPSDVIDRTIVAGEIVSAKDELGFFPSPPDVVDAIMARLSLLPGMMVLEPSAGNGAIAKAAASVVGVDRVHCCEIDGRNVKVLRELGFDTIETDFLKTASNLMFDRIPMNPPFAKQQDIAHVLHALKFLKIDGVLVSVMSAGVMIRSDKKTVAFRDLVAARSGKIYGLPDGSFKASGTSVNTCLAVIPGVG